MRLFLHQPETGLRQQLLKKGPERFAENNLENSQKKKRLFPQVKCTNHLTAATNLIKDLFVFVLDQKVAPNNWADGSYIPYVVILT